MFDCKVKSVSEVICTAWCIQQKFVCIQISLFNFKHRSSLLERCGNTLCISAFDSIFLVIQGIVIHLICVCLLLVKHLQSFLCTNRYNYLHTTIFDELIHGFFYFGFRLSKLSFGQILRNALSLWFRFLPKTSVVDHIVGRWGIGENIFILPCKNSSLSYI